MKLHPKALDLLIGAALVAALSPPAQAAERHPAGGPGLHYGPLFATPWQARLGLSGEPRGLRPELESSGRRLSVFGDYYLPRAFGLRATGGVVLGSGTAPQGATLWPGPGFGLAPGGALPAWRDASLATDAALARNALPYLGLGYTGLAAGGSLGFFADVGMRGLKPRSSVRLGSAAAPGWQGDDGTPVWRLRDWRFEPVLQLGLSYAF